MKAWKRLALICLGGPAVMIAVYASVLSLSQSDWRPTEAEVMAARVESTRPGTPAWSIMVDYSYHAGGEAREGAGLDVFHDSDLEATEAQLDHWAAGERFTIFVDREHPDQVSLSPDGGSQALAVVAAALTPMALMLGWLILVVVQRSRAA